MDSENSDSHELMNLDLGCRLLSEATSIERVLQIRDHAAAWRKYAETVEKSLQRQNEAAEILLRAEREAGLFLQSLHFHGGSRRSSSHAENLNLGKLEIDHNESSRWQELARIPHEIFEEYFREFRGGRQEITRASLFRFARIRNGISPHRQNGKNGHSKGDVTGMLPGLLQLIAGHKSFACICVYPPWPKVRRVGHDVEGLQQLLHFRSQLERLPVAELAADNAHVHLATTSERLEDALDVLHAWKFHYRSNLVCVRPCVEHGRYWLADHELVLLGTKGNNGFRCTTLHSLVELDHSLFAVTPQEVRVRIEQVSDGPFLEIFATNPGPGWTGVSLNGVHDENGE